MKKSGGINEEVGSYVGSCGTWNSLMPRPFQIVRHSFSTSSSSIYPNWHLSGPGVRFPVPPLPDFPDRNVSRLKKKGKKVEPGVPLSIFVTTATPHLQRLQRRIGKKPDYSNFADEIYGRRLDHQALWMSNVMSRRSKLRNGREMNSHVIFGQPTLRGQRLRMLWEMMNLINVEKEEGQRQGYYRQGLGFNRMIEPLESRETVGSRELEVEGMKIIKARKEKSNERLKRSEPFRI